MAKYTVDMQKGNMGESFVMSMLSKHALVNRITGANDIGLDFLCERIHQEEASGILFAVQVKTTNRKVVEIKEKGIDKGLNNLKKFTIKYKTSGEMCPKIEPDTLEYWKNFEIPIYCFVVVENGADNFDCYYKRYTPILHENDMKKAEKEACLYRIYKSGDRFLVFSDEEKQIGGFVRDLFIDYIRCKYYKGHLAYLNPRIIGLNQFPANNQVFIDLYKEYKQKIDATFNIYQSFYKNKS